MSRVTSSDTSSGKVLINPAFSLTSWENTPPFGVSSSLNIAAYSSLPRPAFRAACRHVELSPLLTCVVIVSASSSHQSR
jgi:hypothetical protein